MREIFFHTTKGTNGFTGTLYLCNLFCTVAKDTLTRQWSLSVTPIFFCSSFSTKKHCLTQSEYMEKYSIGFVGTDFTLSV